MKMGMHVYVYVCAWLSSLLPQHGKTFATGDAGAMVFGQDRQ